MSFLHQDNLWKPLETWENDENLKIWCIFFSFFSPKKLLEIYGNLRNFRSMKPWRPWTINSNIQCSLVRRSCELSCACLELLLIELHCRNFYCFYLLLSRNDFEPVALHNRFLDSRTNEIGIRCSLATISAYRLSRGFPLVLLQVMLNVFVTERVQMLRGMLFELFLWAWISHLLSLKSISTCRCLCVHFFRILSWHFAVYRPKHDFCCDEVLRCIMI